MPHGIISANSVILFLHLRNQIKQSQINAFLILRRKIVYYILEIFFPLSATQQITSVSYENASIIICHLSTSWKLGRKKKNHWGGSLGRWVPYVGI